MPALEEKVVNDIKARLERYLAGRPGYGAPEYLTSGGSAAIFKVEGPEGVRAFKGYNPAYFEPTHLPVTQRRLEVQRATIGHTCPYLIQTYLVEEAEGVAFVDMEFLDWPPLNERIADVPDGQVAQLITQLVEAIRYLESKNIVHRDIKPENIHVSPDFTKLILLDLGVARYLDSEEAADAAVTDQGISRPFLATAQYSSPEYLFRLDEPSIRLWKGLNFYQVGAVLHDMIVKKQLFDYEMKLNNRWLVAKAVLTKTPSFSDESPDRLLSLKSLASRCLVKDLDSRLSLVGWDDFQFAGASDPLMALAGRLAKRGISVGEQTKQAARERLEFERGESVKRVLYSARNELLHICQTRLPSNFQLSEAGQLPGALMEFNVSQDYKIQCLLEFHWLEEHHERNSTITTQCRIMFGGAAPDFDLKNRRPVQSLTIGEGEQTLAIALAGNVATVVFHALDIIDSSAESPLYHGLIFEKN